MVSMNKTTKLGMLVAFLLAAASIHAGTQFSSQETSELLKGEIVRRPIEDRTSTRLGGTSYILIKAPVEAIWEALFDFDAYPRIFPRTLETRVVSRKPDKYLLEMKQGTSFLGIKYSLSAAINRKDWEIVCTMVTSRPHDLDEVQGFWRLIPQGEDRTLVAYGAIVSINSVLIRYWAGDVIERGILNAPRDLKHHVERIYGTAGSEP